MLCDICTPMFQSPVWGSHHPNVTSLTKAAESGCYICENLIHWIFEDVGDLKECIVQPLTYRVYRARYPGHVAFAQILVDHFIIKDGKRKDVCRGFIAIPKSSVTADLSIRYRKETLPLSQALQTAQKWMSDCLTGHEQCQKNMKPSSYPTRLIELGDLTLRVTSTEEDKPSGPYASLSYAWGANPRFLCLTESNLPRLQAGVPYSDLPTAFREAADFAKQLSIRYLWIDSLCIIQSGPQSFDDWHCESAKMHEVYSNSILNMSLSRSANPEESCTSGPTLRSVTLPFELETRGLFHGDGDFTNRTCIVTSVDHYQEALYNQPLSFRAWGLQERLLPARVLSFGKGELFWDCTQLVGASESFPSGAPKIAELGLFGIPNKAITSTSDIKELTQMWERILKDYTERDLTRPETDKLIAISAIAERIGRGMDDIYVAGHFWKTLPQSLNWLMEPPLADDYRREGRSRRRINKLANEGNNRSYTPSWSWASMDGQVFWQFQDQDKNASLAEMDAFTVTPVDEENPEGQVPLASLRLSAYWADIQWKSGSAIILGTPQPWNNRTHYLSIIFDDTKDTPDYASKFVIAAIIEDSWLCLWTGLVLTEVEIAGERAYERVGHFTLHDVLQEKLDELRPLFQRDKRIFTLV